MSNPRYLYRLTREKIINTQNYVLKKIGVDCSRDRAAEPISSLFLDLGRKVAINGKIKSTDKIFTTMETINNKEDILKFTNWLSKEFSKANIEKLKTHYSQGQMTRLIAITSNCADKNNLIIVPNAENNLYQKDGEIYFKVKASNFKISHKDDPMISLGEIKGPVEILYKLTDKGFQMEDFSTNSKLLYDMFLGKMPNKDEIMYNIDTKIQDHNDINRIEYALELHQEKLLEFIPGTSASRATKEFTSALKSPRQDLEEIKIRQLEIVPVSKALIAIKQYKEHKIDLKQLQIAVADYQKLADTARPNSYKLIRFFSRNVKPTTTKILNDLQVKLKSIENNQKKQKSATPSYK